MPQEMIRRAAAYIQPPCLQGR